MKRLVHHPVWALWLIATALIALTPCGMAENGPQDAAPVSMLADLSELDRHRVFPHVERAQRSMEQGDLASAIVHWEAALRRAPQHEPLIEAMVQTLIMAGRYEQVESRLEALPRSERKDELRHRARLAWLADPDDPPAIETVSGWLTEATPTRARELVQALGFATEAREGTRAALAQLDQVPCPSSGCAAALRLRSIMAESANQPDRVIASLTRLANHEAWLPQDRERAVAAWIELGEWQALAAHLLDERSAADLELLRTSAQAAIGRGHWHVAQNVLEAVAAHHVLTPGEMQQLSQVYRELGDLERAAKLAYRQGECLQAVDLAWQAGQSEQAMKWFNGCPTAPADYWLNLAVRLEAVELLAQQSFDEQVLEEQRLTTLAVILEQRGDDERLIESLRGQPGPVAQAYLLAALERQQRYLDAARLHEQRFDRSADIDDLERASYFYILAGENDEAARLLIAAMPHGDDPAGQRLSLRLLGLYPQETLDPQARHPVTLASTAAAPELRVAAAQTLQRIGRCDEVRGLELPTGGEEQGALHMLLGFCLQAAASPGLAAHHFEAAHRASVDLALEPLAISLAEAGHRHAALERFEELDEQQIMADPLRVMWVEAALSIGDYSAASHQFERLDPATDDEQWWSMQARIAQGMGEFETALSHWQTLHQRWPQAEASFQIGVIQWGLGEREQAVEALAEAVERAPDQVEYLAEYAYALEPLDRERAVQVFQRVAEMEPWRFRIHEQIGHLEAEQYHDEEARESFRHAIDLLHSDLPPPGLDREETIERSYLARRSHESLGRKWNVSAGGWIATGSVPGEFFFEADPPRHYADVTLSRRLTPRSGLGSVHARGRLIGQGPSDDVLANRAATLGLLWQVPVGITVLGVDWLEPESGHGQFLVHGATELLSTGRYRRDWRPVSDSWREQRLYVEGAWWTRSDDYLVSARYDYAWHRPLRDDTSASWFPYVLAESRLVRGGHDLRAGAGLGLRLWGGAREYDAYRRLHSIRLEFQHAFETNIADRNGLFLRVGSEW
ncbi:tetratricopeptide repeat protein [Wenzhouxiangella sp. AB-CW3]|uniref:NfrA family protein n=1 Tax=Wenzhouxiangella sp. AB-CW3 TaxID=2771012 RepID=UPI00168B94C9|nr:tetratricopeptide repeat protein [Wenzhouxiangella sp. AB-CW3]QOC23754.1 tetratricopeptide repeat protein [Wenzhouxiangella sp. AB-CW3]